MVRSDVPEPAVATICQCGDGYTRFFDILAHLPSAPPLNFNDHSVKNKNKEDEKDDDDVDDDNINNEAVLLSLLSAVLLIPKCIRTC
jgi:hypothetical protein